MYMTNDIDHPEFTYRGTQMCSLEQEEEEEKPVWFSRSSRGKLQGPLLVNLGVERDDCLPCPGGLVCSVVLSVFVFKHYCSLVYYGLSALSSPEG